MNLPGACTRGEKNIWGNYKAGLETSHILKHHVLHHRGQGEPTFHLRAVKFFKTALSRQIAEACRIQKLGEDAVLNSKDEFNRSKIRRLVIGDDKPVGPPQVMDDKEEEMQEEERNWEVERAQMRRI